MRLRTEARAFEEQWDPKGPPKGLGTKEPRPFVFRYTPIMGLVLFWISLGLLTLLSAYYIINGVVMCFSRKPPPVTLSKNDEGELKLFAQYLEELGSDGSWENQKRAYEKVYGRELT